MGRGSSIRAGAAFVELKSKDNGFSRGLKQAQRRLDRFGAAARKVGRGLLTGGGAIVVAGAIAARIFARMGDELDKASKRTGFTVEALSELGFAAEQSGADLATLEKGIKSMQRSINDASRGLSTQVDALDALGLRYQILAVLSPEDQFILIAESLARIEDPGKRAALAMQLLGRAGQKLLPLFEGGAGGMEKLRQQARDLGIVVSAEAAAAAAEMTDELNITKRVIRALVFEVGAALAPAIIKAAKVIARIVSGGIQWVKQNQKIIRTIALVAGAVVGVGGAIIGIGIVAKILAFSIGGLVSLFALLGAVAAIAGTVLASVLTPIGLVAVGVSALSSLIAVKSVDIGSTVGQLGGFFKNLATIVGDTMGGITNAIVAGNLALAVQIAGKGMELAWSSIVVAMKSQWIDFMAFIQKTLLQLPNTINGLITGVEFGLGTAFGDPGQFLGGGPRVPGGGNFDFNDLIDKGADAKKSKLQEELRALQEQLKLLNANAPGGSSGGANPRDPYDGFIQAITRSGTSARGVFNSASLKSLSSPVEKSIEENTARSAQSLVQIARSVKNGGLRFT